MTFYAFFNLEPQGRNTVCVCRGTACHIRGSQGLLDVLTDTLGIDRERRLPATTADGDVTLRTVACFGQCALAPIVEVNHEVFGHV
ncbi:NAD(P)H-dependent oxidoreductase subunit E, partial [Mycobacterium tuberculosis]|nr:NAD(P)H-dependent oxidoreductase subunit E [Mycobacterium tuberculosis]